MSQQLPQSPTDGKRPTANSPNQRGMWIAGVAVLTLVGLVVITHFILSRRSPADQQQIAQIQRLRGLVCFDQIVPNFVEQNTPRSLQHALPQGSVTAIAFFGPRPNDDELRGPLTHFRDLKEIRLSNTAITDASLGPISQQTFLWLLWLEGTGVSDSGVEILSANKSVTHVFLDNTKVTDAGIAHLARMTQIQTLSLAGTGITDAAVEDLFKLPQLRFLDVTGTKISESGMERLRTRGKLELCSGLASR